MKEEDINKNLRRGGEYFIYSQWIQSQMVDLIVFYDHPEIIQEFVDKSEKIPVILREKRIEYWQKNFRQIKDDFIERFKNDITEQCHKDIATLYNLRNALAHSYVSLDRNYFLHRPGNEKRLAEFEAALDVVNPSVDAFEPRIFKLDYSNDKIYFHNFAAIQRMDEVHLKSLAESLNVPHSRIR